MQSLKYDVVIIGAGVSGLFAAYNLPKHLKVLILCKEQPWECNTFYAQGGITIAKGKEDIPCHIKDTIQAGSTLNDKKSVELLSTKSIEILEDLQKSGFHIDKDEQGNIMYAKEGGHSIARIIHSGGDGTGRALHTHLINSLQHTLWKSADVIDLLIEDDLCYGVAIRTKRGLLNIYANHTIIASGGVGGLFKYHTNAYSISSDLHGIALSHNLALQDMEMLQFHPSVFVDTPHARKYLISEAVRGEGGKIVDKNGDRFLFKYDSRGELAPRDIVSRSIYKHCLDTGEDRVYLDLSSFSHDGFQARFPNIYRDLKSCKVDIPHVKVPISPAFHYSMGGIKVSLEGRVDNMRNLYAIGECASNGVHGANRLASNSLLEGLVFGKIVGQSIATSTLQLNARHFPLCEEILEKDGDLSLKNVLREIMWSKVGILRSKDGLNSALGGVEVMMQSNIGRMLKLRLLVARNIILSALRRDESLGAHYMIPKEENENR